ncbi:MAG: RluA family pseudouridine synthase [Chloroflexi bacterium]|nr:RluA family pseudouridine synthase [Chloroflexota bacterium]
MTASIGTAKDSRREFEVEVGQVRLDQFLALQDTQLTRAQLHRLIVQGQVLLNGRSAKPAQKVRSGDLVSLTIPPPRVTDVVPQWMPLTLVYQDSDIVVIDKPAGLSVHPGPGHPDQTLVNGLLARCPDIQGVGGAIRPGIVHRLDKDTSGLMMVAKNHHAHQELSNQIKDRRVTKGYMALTTGVVSPDAGIIDQPIARDPRHRKRMAVVAGGRESRTRYRVVENPSGYSLLELVLETGRTHQIRVHLAHLGHPLLGDGVYGKASPILDRHFLHAYLLGFQHPRTGEALEFRAELPPDLAGVLDDLRSGSG